MVLSSSVSPATWTLDDYHRMVTNGILEGRPVELLWGNIINMAPEGEPHAYSSDEAGEYLIYLLGQRAKVRQAKPITIPNLNSEPEPDIAIVKRLGKVYQQHHPYPEDVLWVIEYSQSSLKKDIEVKAKLYAQADIAEYWIIDLQQNRLILLREPTADGYMAETIFTDGIVCSLAFPEITIEVGKLMGFSQ